MSKSKHTPEPWLWEKNPSGPWPILKGSDPDGGWIAMAADPTTDDSQLLKAAPETARQRDALLEAAEAALIHVSYQAEGSIEAAETADMLEAALADAKKEEV